MINSIPAGDCAQWASSGAIVSMAASIMLFKYLVGSIFLASPSAPQPLPRRACSGQASLVAAAVVRRGSIINESLDIVESGEKMMEWPDTDDEAT